MSASSDDRIRRCAALATAAALMLAGWPFSAAQPASAEMPMPPMANRLATAGTKCPATTMAIWAMVPNSVARVSWFMILPPER